MAERVGVLLVHGIGEQGRFTHLEAEVRNLVRAWESRGARVHVQINRGDSSVFGAQQDSWRTGDAAPIEVLLDHAPRHGNRVRDAADPGDGNRSTDHRTQVDFHEVWWADLDEPPTLWSQFRFWFWGLSLWATRRYVQPASRAYRSWMRPPDHWCGSRPGLTAGRRAQLFVLGMILLMTFFTLSLVNFLCDWIFRRRPFPSDILVNYLGDVKLYQQQWRPGKGPLGNLGQPPRVALRQRMVRQMLHMAQAGYDRWYILSHSQGTILAFNALMEPAERLPHYLSEAEWRALQPQFGRSAGGVGTLGGAIDPASDTASGGAPDAATDPDLLAELRPPRPVWLHNTDAVDRQRAFAGLRGLLTYGSPLETFASLWPAIVSLNRDENVFRSDFEWINIADPSDPVATCIHHFDPISAAQPRPRNVWYRAQGWHLVSHIRYLSCADDPQRLAPAVAAWIEGANAFATPPTGTRHWPSQRSARWVTQGQVLTWIGWALLLAMALGKGLHSMLCYAAGQVPAGSAVATVLIALCELTASWALAMAPLPDWLAHGTITLGASAAIVATAGAIARTPLCRHGRL